MIWCRATQSDFQNDRRNKNKIIKGIYLLDFSFFSKLMQLKVFCFEYEAYFKGFSVHGIKKLLGTKNTEK